VQCSSASFAATGGLAETYASVPEYLPVGYVIHSHCDGAGRFDLGATTETIKCTAARGRDGVLNQSPSGCHSTPLPTLNL